MDWNSMSNTAIIEEIGRRIKGYRLKKRYTQRDMAKHAGVSLFTIAKIEAGQPVSISMLIPVLRVLRLLDNLEMLFPEIDISPVELMKLKRKTPKRNITD
ncbi:MAG: helix-turn-helix domain-containing protein [Tannerellaceae bacterium]|jgi:DNA-binding XRE family transcriptional regulator|nr:helix-turn-helix domain-containing protein [Tannerellaceae bacterium]